MSESSSSARPVRMRFNLRLLLIATALLAAAFAYLGFFQTTTRTVTYHSIRLDSGSFDASGATQVDDSAYAWKMLSEAEANALKKTIAEAPESVLFQSRETVSRWPNYPTIQQSSNPGALDVNDPRQGPNAKRPYIEHKRLSGFLGVRIKGGQLQFSVLGSTTVRALRNHDTLGPDETPPLDEVDGRLTYQGDAPDHGLAFFAPIDENRINVVLFVVESDE